MIYTCTPLIKNMIRIKNHDNMYLYSSHKKYDIIIDCISLPLTSVIQGGFVKTLLLAKARTQT